VEERGLKLYQASAKTTGLAASETTKIIDIAYTKLGYQNACCGCEHV
jgi:hypothetical protein